MCRIYSRYYVGNTKYLRVENANGDSLYREKVRRVYRCNFFMQAMHIACYIFKRDDLEN